MSFFDGGNKSVSFGEVDDTRMLGVWQGGVVVNINNPAPAMSYDDPTKQKTFKSGEGVTKIVISLDTASGQYPAAALDEEDDGTRDLHVDKGSGQARAIGNALRTAKAKDIATGGQLYIRWTSGRGKKGDARQYESVYVAPAQGTSGMFDEPAAAPVHQPTPQQAPVQAVMPPQVAPQQAPVAQGGFDPQTGQPLVVAPAQQAAPQFPPFNAQTGQPQDPYTGQPLAQPTPQQAPVQAVMPNQPVTNPYRQ
jgi:hypothetical protein